MIIGIIPAAGSAQRLQPIPISKEIFPLLDKNEYPTPLESLIEKMIIGGAKQIFITTNSKKLDLVQYVATKYKNRKSITINIIFKESKSLPESLTAICDIFDQNCKTIALFGLPDTVWKPNNSFKEIIREQKKTNQDLVFGLFNNKNSALFDSVNIDSDNIIKDIGVKIDLPLSEWFWGIGAIKISFLKMIKKEMVKNKKNHNGEPLFGDIVNKLSTNNISGIKLDDNKYYDLGLVERIKHYYNEN